MSSTFLNTAHLCLYKVVEYEKFHEALVQVEEVPADWFF
jgi:hypothetical protein